MPAVFLLVAALSLALGHSSAVQSPAVVKRIVEVLPTVRRDLETLDVTQLSAAERQRYSHAKYLLAEVERIGRTLEEKSTREVDAVALLERAAAEAAALTAKDFQIRDNGVLQRYRDAG